MQAPKNSCPELDTTLLSDDHQPDGVAHLTPARRSRSVYPKHGRRKHDNVFIIGAGQRNCSERNLPWHVVTKGYRIPARDVISMFVLARMLAGSSDEKKKKKQD